MVVTERPRSKVTKKYIVNAFRSIIKISAYHDKWIFDSTWVELIENATHVEGNNDLSFTAGELNKALSFDAAIKMNNIDCYTVANQLGLYKSKVNRSKITPNTAKARRTDTQTAYYVTSGEGRLPPLPGGNRKWYDTVESVTATRMTRSTVQRVQPNLVTPAKSSSSEKSSSSKKSRKTKRSESIRKEDFWESPEAILWFGFEEPTEDSPESIREVVQARIKRLKVAFLEPEGWKQVVDDFDIKNLCSSVDIFRIQTKARIIATALQIALKKLRVEGGHSSWKACMQEALDISKDHNLGVSLIKSTETIRNAHKQFRTNNEAFPNPKVDRSSGRPKLPPMLDRNPDLKDKLNEYCRDNLDVLSGELVYSWLHNEGLPQLIKDRNEEVRQDCENQGGEDLTFDDILKENGLSNLCQTTVYNWMNILKFKYGPRKKTYFVDSHEKPENVTYRDEYFVPRYLKLERRAFRWIQITPGKVEELKKEGKLEVDGYKYQDEQGNDMVEFHVDSSEEFHAMCKDVQFGGYLSVRKPPGERPIFFFGQDECIFKQYTFTPSAWTAPDGKRPLVPKDDGLGRMISGYNSREFGFGMELTQEQLERVNAKRQGQEYQDKEAAEKLFGKSEKGALKESPFVSELNYGAAGDGYWQYENTVIQLEDCVDVLKTLYPEVDLVFLFDHSSGHSRMKPDGLRANKVSKEYGGAQPKMRPTEIKKLGRFLASLNIGDIQSLVYKEGDEGPRSLSPEDRVAKKFDRPTGKKIVKKRKKAQLQALLREKGVHAQGSLIEISKSCENNNIALTVEVEEIEQGWLGRPKGAYQILWERGFIDESKGPNYYTMKGRKDKYGVPIEGTSLRDLLAQQEDFINETTCLQHHAQGMGVEVLCSPKCHPELAGEGIEYAWGCAKGLYRRLPIGEKRSKEKFVKTVRRVLARKQLTLERCRKFSRRARIYILAYKHLAENAPEEKLSVDLIEKVVKTFKTHRAADSFDRKFCKQIVESMRRDLLD